MRLGIDRVHTRIVRRLSLDLDAGQPRALGVGKRVGTCAGEGSGAAGAPVAVGLRLAPAPRSGEGLGGEGMARVKAYVLIVTDPLRTKEVFEQLKQIPQLVELHEVMGPYDIVCEIEAGDLTEIPPILGERIRRIPGIESTTSLVTFPEP